MTYDDCHLYPATHTEADHATPPGVTPIFPEDIRCEVAGRYHVADDIDSNEHRDAWCRHCGERLLAPGYAGGPMA